LNLQLSGELLQEIRKKYRYLRTVSGQDGKPVLQATKKLPPMIGAKPFYVQGSVEKWETIPVVSPPEKPRTVVQIYPNRIWDIEELL